MNDSIWLILWIRAKNDSMAFLRPYKSILQSELVTSSNNSTTREIPRREEKISRFNQILSNLFFFLFFSFSPTVLFVKKSGEILRDET